MLIGIYCLLLRWFMLATGDNDNYLSNSLGAKTNLVGDSNRVANDEGKVLFSVINGKKVKITLNTDKKIDENEAQVILSKSLEKISKLDQFFKLGENVNGKTTNSLTIHPDRVTRHYSQGIQELTHNYTSKEINQKIANVLEETMSDLSEYSIHVEVDQGKYFEDSFKVNGRLVATEKAERADTVSMLIKSLNTKKDKLSEKLIQAKATGTRDYIDLEKEIKKIEEDIKKYSENTAGTTHASANMPRFAFMKMGREKAKEEMAPLLTNLRIQTVEDAEGNIVSSVTRSGAITDFSHGEVSLQELRDLKDLERCANLIKGGLRVNDEAAVEARVKQLYLAGNDANISDVALLVKAKALVGYGAANLVADYKESPAVTKLLKKLQSGDRIEDQFAGLSTNEKQLLQAIMIDSKKLENVIAQRSAFLKQLLLQDFQLQLEKTPHKNQDPILFSRTSLIDLKKGSNNEGGCVIHERTQGLDMYAIFNELQGATVIFEDIEAAYFDDAGQIHMPKKCAAEGVESADLNPFFFNICVQAESGYPLNDGMQKVMNDESLERLEAKYGQKEEFIKLKDSLASLEHNDQDPNESVLLLTQFIQKNEGYSGIKCFGGKDRTAYAVAVITFAAIAKLAGIPVASPEMKEVGHQLLRAEGIAGKIAKDNADHTTLKVTRWDLLLYDVKSPRGLMLRIAHGIDALFLATKPRFKKLVRKTPFSISSTPGQAYYPHAKETLDKINSFSGRFLNFFNWR